MGQEGAVSQDKDQPVQGRGRAERAREYKKHEFLVYVLDAYNIFYNIKKFQFNIPGYFSSRIT